MRWSFAAATSVALLVVAVGCSSTPAATPTPPPGGATQAPGGATQAPGGATQAPGGATQAPGGVGLTGHECDAVPTAPPDNDLLAHFPAQIDGVPVTDATSGSWVYTICSFGGQALLEQSAGDMAGINFANMTFGSASATVEGEDVTLSAFRTPGTDANQFVQALAALAAQSGDLQPGELTASTVAGRTVFVHTDTDGTISYAFPSGDTLIFFDATESQAAKIIAALP
jgi:hypothetical protein